MPFKDSPSNEIDDPLIATRTELAQFCRTAGTRTCACGNPAEGPWTPETVIDPATDQPYTAESAWQRIAVALETGSALEVVSAEPPDADPVYITRWRHGHAEVIVRLQRGTTKVIGRSFYYATTPTSDRRS